MDVGKIIRDRRTELGLTLEEIGTYVGVGKSTVKKWESGYIKNIKRDKIALLAEILKLSPLTFITGELRLESPAPEEEVLTVHERAVLTAYRAKPEMQKAVDTLLGVAEEQPAIADDMKDTVALGEAVFGKARTAAK